MALILFDGVCNLCNGFVQFVIQRDAAGRFRFAALQSAASVLADFRHRAIPRISPLPPASTACVGRI